MGLNAQCRQSEQEVADSGAGQCSGEIDLTAAEHLDVTIELQDARLAADPEAVSAPNQRQVVDDLVSVVGPVNRQRRGVTHSRVTIY